MLFETIWNYTNFLLSKLSPMVNNWLSRGHGLYGHVSWLISCGSCFLSLATILPSSTVQLHIAPAYCPESQKPRVVFPAACRLHDDPQGPRRCCSLGGFGYSRWRPAALRTVAASWRGQEKRSVSNTPKPPKQLGKEPLWHMLYYTQKLSVVASQSAVEDCVSPSAQDSVIPAGAAMFGEDDISAGIHGMAVDPENGGTDDFSQPTLGDILQAVQKCTASVDDLGNTLVDCRRRCLSSAKTCKK